MTRKRGSASSRNTSSTKTASRSAFPAEGFPKEGQGRYYCGVGYSLMGDIAREIVNKHLDLCLDAGINHEGINSEVAKGQWEFQIFGKGSKKAADEMWVARYLLMRLCEKYGVDVNYHCKPLGNTDWNGSGMHSNFSTKYLREVGGKEYFEALMAAFDKYKAEHIAVYGPDNHLRLTGLHETQSIDKFNYGVAESRCVHPRPEQHAEKRLQGISGRSPSQLPGRPLQDRQPDSRDHRHRAASEISRRTQPVSVPFDCRRSIRSSCHSNAALTRAALFFDAYRRSSHLARNSRNKDLRHISHSTAGL